MRMVALLRRGCLTLCLLAGLAAPAAAVQVERVVSPGGIEAWLVRDTMLPLVALEFAFRGGAALDPPGKEGLAHMATGLLTEGAGDLESQAFQSALEDRVISLDINARFDTLQGSVKALNEHRDEAVRMLSLALTQPRFDAPAVERVRAQILASLARSAEDPDTIAQRSWMETAFPSHPYGRPSRGTPETVRDLGVADFRGFVERRLARDNLVVGAVGDITAAELGQLLDRAFGALPAKSAPDTVANVSPAGGGRTIVHRRTVPQSKVLFGHQGVSRTDPDYYAAYAVNYILGGGGFTSRLMTEVREKRGLAYSVYSYLSNYDHATIWLGGTGTENARVAKALEVIRDEWRRMRDDGPTADELADAKTYLTGSFPLRLDSTQRVAGTLVAMQMDNLGIDYLDKRNAFIEAVTLEDARRVARRLLHPDRLLVVAVGQPEGLVGAEGDAQPAGGQGTPALPAARGQGG